MAATTSREYVDVLTLAGTIPIDVQASVDAGLLDVYDDGAAGEVTSAVREAIKGEKALINATGARVLIVGSVVAYTFKIRK